MPKRTVLIVLVIVVVAAMLAGIVASSLTASVGDADHEMPDGSTMQGEQMP
jgi:archaellum component FlaG (FlaF/FlaG flagellin family)